MAKVVIRPGMSNLKEWEELRRFTSMGFESLVDEVNGRLDFVANIRASGPHTVTFQTSADIMTITHNLGKVPQGFLMIDLNAGEVVYRPISPVWTAQKAYLQASGAVTATVLII